MLAHSARDPARELFFTKKMHLTMDLDLYNSSFIEILDSIDEEAEHRLHTIRRQCIQDLVDRLTRRQQEWNDAYLEILRKSQELDEISLPPLQPLLQQPKPLTIQETPKPPPKEPAKIESASSARPAEVNNVIPPAPPKAKEEEFSDPYFSNQYNIKEYLRIQSLLENAKNSCLDINMNPASKPIKNELVMLIRTQINSISNSDPKHLESKTQILTNLFNGQGVNFQNRIVTATQHPQGQTFCLYTAAQIFVTVGSRLVNSVPAIASTMAQVIEGIVRNNFPVLKDLIIGNLQERCPYVVPISPRLDDFVAKMDDTNASLKYKIACGYNYDSSSQTLETEEKYLIRMRSMILIYSCLLMQGHMNESWTWLASFLSIKPQPVISATILQAFLQESSKKMSSTYGRQYKKIIVFIRSYYIKMIEEVTPNGVDRQSLIKFKNLMSDDSNLISAPSISSIFRPCF